MYYKRQTEQRCKQPLSPDNAEHRRRVDKRDGKIQAYAQYRVQYAVKPEGFDYEKHYTQYDRDKRQAEKAPAGIQDEHDEQQVAQYRQHNLKCDKSGRLIRPEAPIAEESAERRQDHEDLRKLDEEVLPAGRIPYLFVFYLHLASSRSERPVSVFEYLHSLAAFGLARDIEILGAYHEILMDHGRIYAHFAALLERVVFKVLYAVCKSVAEREVACGVFIKKGIIKHYAAVSYRTVKRHERALAEHFRAFVHVHERLERILALLGLDLCHLTVFKADAEVFDHRAAVGQRSGRIHYALGLSLHGACENLFAGDVGIKAHVCPERILRSGEKLRLRNESDGEIRSVCAFIVQLAQAERVEILAAALEIGIVLLPCLHSDFAK